MLSTLSSVRKYAYILIRMKFTENKLLSSSLFGYSSETNDVYSIWGLVSLDETPIVAIVRYLRELAGFRLARNFSMFLCNIIWGYKDHEPT